jgi:hypothetical protein
VLATVLLVGGIGGVVFAQTGNGDDSQPKARYGALLDRVCAIYQEKTGVTIDKEVLKAAFTQAASEMRPKAPQNSGEMKPGDMPKRPGMGPEDMQGWLQNLVQQGKITQGQADEYLKWWQSKPNTEQFQQQLKDWQQGRPDIPPELKQWQEAKPDLPLGFGPRGHGGFPGMGGFPGGVGPCTPPPASN